MYKVYVDKVLFNKEKSWKNIANDEKFEVISYTGFSDLIVKLNLEDNNIIYLFDYSTSNDCYEKIRVLKGKFASCALNVVNNGIKLEAKHLNRLGVNASLKANDANAIRDTLNNSANLIDTFNNESYVHVEEHEYKDISVVSVIGASGGVGKTTIATNLAASFAEFGLKTCLVDFSLQFGDVAMFTNVKPNFTVYDMLLNKMDFTPNLNLFIEHVNPNLFVLPAPVLPEQADYITRAMVSKLIQNLSTSFDVLVFDTPSIVNDLCLELYKLSKQIVMVTTKDLAALKNTKLQLDILDKLSLTDKIKLVLNKHDSPKFIVKNDDVRKMLNVDVLTTIPHTNTVTVNSINMGVPFIYSYPKEPISDHIRELMSKVRYNCIVGGYDVEKK
ncbi:MAG: P-loop NTPase [Bacilli bacterium]|nr:P-loop NTPase [Bacilli bacterium]